MNHQDMITSFQAMAPELNQPEIEDIFRSECGQDFRRMVHYLMQRALRRDNHNNRNQTHNQNKSQKEHDQVEAINQRQLQSQGQSHQSQDEPKPNRHDQEDQDQLDQDPDKSLGVGHLTQKKVNTGSKKKCAMNHQDQLACLQAMAPQLGESETQRIFDQECGQDFLRMVHYLMQVTLRRDEKNPLKGNTNESNNEETEKESTQGAQGEMQGNWQTVDKTSLSALSRGGDGDGDEQLSLPAVLEDYTEIQSQLQRGALMPYTWSRATCAPNTRCTAAAMMAVDRTLGHRMKEEGRGMVKEQNTIQTRANASRSVATATMISKYDNSSVAGRMSYSVVAV